MGYFSAVRHPWPCLVFLIPLLGVYEIGVVALGGSSELRAGVDLWVRQLLTNNGVAQMAVVPGVVIGLLGLWCFLGWNERPERVFTSVFGIVIESVLFGLGLWTLCRNAPYLAERFGIPFAAVGPDSKAKVITFIGVGIYEEVIFRLLLFAGFAQLLRYVLIPGIAALPMAALVSSVAFALAHHIDLQSDPYIPLVFATRVMIGLYCAALFWWRGLGVVIGTHIVYDLLVGLR